MMRLSANAYYEDDRLPSVELCLDELFFVSELLDVLLGTKKDGMKRDTQESRR